MPKVKLPRKSTTIDMTAMCDVAFLLLSFFILTTKFKPAEALAVVTPSSVQNKIAPSKDFVMITIDKDGKVYFSVSDENASEKQAIMETVNSARNLGLSAAEINAFKQPAAYIGTPFSQLKSYLAMNPEQLKAVKAPGIPVLDSANNELTEWIRAAVTAFQGTKMNILVKGDNSSKYPSFQAVINSLKKNEQFKFQMITNPIGVPEGTELFKKNMSAAPAAAAE
jgi:biopolymer transport protein ExbD